ncbi:CoA transferase [Geothermobacter hydrogeniphilus]|uniref:Carnitine dehydratase n=1 Tax=Geothermobacter hydrogeniphilus TaxID=1969733 RepID=A0A1X0Y604_9BACT|nr:CoA transferase [Geothermobacter hydrogeniphilus]ORJ60575.1 carnitine dehydratase [Geothermobacter hydrogeniphilus]
MSAKPLAGLKVVTLAVNLPGPVAARALLRLGASVTKVEPAAADPMQHYCADWYRDLNAGQAIIRLDLKTEEGRAGLARLLQEADLLITATRPVSLAKLGLGWEELHEKYPRLCQVAIVGHAAPRHNEPGHDLTYQAEAGLLSPPQLPRTLLADMAGAEQAVGAALALLLGRERGAGSGFAEVALASAAAAMAEPLRYGVTAAGALLGGGLAGYNLYRARDGWVALAALEPHFLRRVAAELHCDGRDKDALQKVFLNRTAGEWQQWGLARDLPLVALVSRAVNSAF